MNVSFKVVRRAGDKAYILSEITGYDERLPVVLTVSTEEGMRIPSDTFPYCDPADPVQVAQVLSDGALASHGVGPRRLHTRNSAGIRFFVIVLPWMDIRRWVLEFRAMESSGMVVDSCVKRIDVGSAVWLDRLNARTNQLRGEAIEMLDGRFVHDRIRVNFVRAIETRGTTLVSALVELPYHEESELEFDFLDGSGRHLDRAWRVIEDSIDRAVDFGSFERRYLVLSFEVDRAEPELCLCVTDTVGQVAPGFAMLGAASLFSLLADTGEATQTAEEDPDYDAWFKAVHSVDLPTLLEQVSARFDQAPTVSVVCPIQDAPLHHVHDLMDSLLTQSYGRWELILVDDGTADDGLTDLIAAADDERVFMVRAPRDASGFAALANAGIHAAEGEFCAFVRSSDTLAPDALFECMRTVNQHPACDFLYGDSDARDADGIHSLPVFRSGYSPELLRSNSYIDDFLVVRTALLERIGGVDEERRGAFTYDLVLRCAEESRVVRHVPRVLCHRRLATKGLGTALFDEHIDQEQERRALVAHCSRTGIKAEVLSLDRARQFRVRHVLAQTPRISLVVASADNAECLMRCLLSLESKVHYRNYEVIVLDGGSVDPLTWEAYRRMEERFPDLKVVSADDVSNRSRFLNSAARQADGEFLLFLDDDARFLTDDPLEAMLGYFQSPDVAVVGSECLFVDGTIEHAGLVVGGAQATTPLSRFMPLDWPGYLGQAGLSRNVSAVDRDCMMVRRSIFDQVGGFTEEFASFFGDVDFCLKARDRGYLTVFTPHVRLGRFTSVSRTRTYSTALSLQLKRESALLESRWPRAYVEGDEFHNANLDPDGAYCALRW